MRRVLPVLALLAVAACVGGTQDSTDSTDSSVHSGSSYGAELTLPLNAKQLANEFVRRGIRSKSDALALLPRPLKQRFVLMKSTGALGVATPDRPRVIHFEEDGRFILASTGHKADEDVTANSLEILEEDAVTHEYRTHVISFDASRGATLTEDDQRCKGCHGSPARPIWGSYPNWPDAYGADDDKMTPEEHASFDAFVETAKTDVDYKHLEIHPSSYGFYLPLPYGYPNTNINQALGIRWAAQLAARMAKSPHYAELGKAVAMASLYCNYSSATEARINQLYSANTFAAEARYPARRPATKVYRLLGVEPTTDLRVENPLLVPPDVDYDVGMAPWDAGSDYLTNLIAFPIFSALLKNDPTLQQLYTSQLSKIAYADEITFKGDLTTMMSLTDTSTPTYYDATHLSAYNYIHAPVLESKRAEVCAALERL